MVAWYNEIDPYAADWLENLIAAGLIAPGVAGWPTLIVMIDSMVWASTVWLPETLILATPAA